MSAPATVARGIIDKPALSSIEFTSSARQLQRGATLFGRRCSVCHGIGAVSGGDIADPRYALPTTYDKLDKIVLQGAYQQLGMPKFYFLKQDDVAAIKSYLLSRRKELMDALH